MEEALEFEISCSGGFAAVARGLRSKSVFGSGAEADDVPGEAGGSNVFGNSIGEALRERDHVFKRSGRENVFERGSHSG